MNPSCRRSRITEPRVTRLDTIELRLERRAGGEIQLAGHSDHRCAPVAADIEAKAGLRAARRVRRGVRVEALAARGVGAHRLFLRVADDRDRRGVLDAHLPVDRVADIDRVVLAVAAHAKGSEQPSPQRDPVGAQRPLEDQIAPIDLVVHPHHGAGRVVSRGRRRLAGSERSYLEIELIAGGLKIMVPCQSASAVGLRAVVSPGQLAQITAVLEGDPGALQGTWSWRERQYREKLKSGDVLALAAVLRDLAAQPRLTAREDQLHDRLRALLASELACALQIDITQAGTYIDQHVARARRSQATPTATGP